MEKDHNKGFGKQGGHLGFKRLYPLYDFQTSLTPTCSWRPKIMQLQTMIFHPRGKGPKEQ